MGQVLLLPPGTWVLACLGLSQSGAQSDVQVSFCISWSGWAVPALVGTGDHSHSGLWEINHPSSSHSCQEIHTAMLTLNWEKQACCWPRGQDTTDPPCAWREVVPAMAVRLNDCLHRSSFKTTGFLRGQGVSLPQCSHTALSILEFRTPHVGFCGILTPLWNKPGHSFHMFPVGGRGSGSFTAVPLHTGQSVASTELST